MTNFNLQKKYDEMKYLTLLGYKLKGRTSNYFMYFHRDYEKDFDLQIVSPYVLSNKITLEANFKSVEDLFLANFVAFYTKDQTFESVINVFNNKLKDFSTLFERDTTDYKVRIKAVMSTLEKFNLRMAEIFEENGEKEFKSILESKTLEECVEDYQKHLKICNIKAYQYKHKELYEPTTKTEDKDKQFLNENSAY